MSDDITRWDIRKVKLADVKPMDSNPRRITNKAMAGLRRSMGRFGYVEPIVWNERTGQIVGGHQRYNILVKYKVEEANMVVVDLPPEEEAAANLTLNNPEIQGEWAEPITELLEGVQDHDDELFSALNMGDLQDALKSKDNGEKGTREGTVCPCCGHSWKMTGDDVVLTEEDS